MSKNKKKRELGPILKGGLSFLSGMVGSVNPVLGLAVGAVKGAVEKAKEVKAANLASTIGGEGKVDGAHASGLVVGVGITVAVILGGIAVGTGFLTMDQVLQLMGIVTGNTTP
jgi:hypothetical protein